MVGETDMALRNGRGSRKLLLVLFNRVPFRAIRTESLRSGVGGGLSGKAQLH